MLFNSDVVSTYDDEDDDDFNDWDEDAALPNVSPPAHHNHNFRNSTANVIANIVPFSSNNNSNSYYETNMMNSSRQNAGSTVSNHPTSAVTRRSTFFLKRKPSSIRHPPLNHPPYGVPSYETFPALAPIVIGGKRWTYRLSISSLLPDEPTLKMLHDTFDIVKIHADEVSLQALRSLLDRLPGVAETFQKAGRIHHADDDWELTQHGRLWLNAIEKCISRGNNATALRTYLSQLAKIHNRVAVRSTQIPVAIHAFESTILNLLRLHHKHAEQPAAGSVKRSSTLNEQLLAIAELPTVMSRRSSASSNVGANENTNSSNNNNTNNDDDNNNNRTNNNNETTGDQQVDNGANESDSPTLLPNCPICSGWRNFFDLINILMVTDMNE